MTNPPSPEIVARVCAEAQGLICAHNQGSFKWRVAASGRARAKPNPHKGKSANPAREPQAPRSYDPEVAYQARKLCQLGATDIELADFFGVCRETIYRWIIEFPGFSDAIKVGKEPADDRVERSLYQRSVGIFLRSRQDFHAGRSEATGLRAVPRARPA